MDNERWSWFAGGVVVGLLIGVGISAGVGISKLQQARAEAERNAALAAEAEAIAREQAVAAERQARKAEGLLLESLERRLTQPLDRKGNLTDEEQKQLKALLERHGAPAKDR